MGWDGRRWDGQREAASAWSWRGAGEEGKHKQDHKGAAVPCSAAPCGQPFALGGRAADGRHRSRPPTTPPAAVMGPPAAARRYLCSTQRVLQQLLRGTSVRTDETTDATPTRMATVAARLGCARVAAPAGTRSQEARAPVQARVATKVLTFTPNECASTRECVSQQ
eukprot:scaffold2083_cov419-Prasinococcus_capsulatus_cf.AAC.3